MTRRRLLVTALAAGILFSSIPYQVVQAEERNAGEEKVALTQEMVDEANEKYNNNQNVALEFISMSDTHVASYESKKWAFQNIEDWSESIGFEADTVMVDGDVEANEREEAPGNSVKFYTAVEQLMEETFGRLPIQFATGNHDIQTNMEKVFDENGWGQYWHYKSKIGDTYNNFHVNINGFDFISLDYRNGSRYKKFLEDTLAEISSKEGYDAGKPIFLQIHSGLSGTTTGSYQDCGGTATYLQNTLADWPQAVVMTAHSHYSSEVETGIYQKDFTVVNNGSMDYVELDDSNTIENEVLNWVQGNMEDKHYELTCNYITVMEDGTTVIRRFDVTNKRWMGIPWEINTEEGKEGFRYTADKRNKTSPWFEETTEITMEEVGENTANIVFDQAVDDQLVEYYKITVRDFLTNKDASYKVLPENFDYAGDASYKIPKGVTGSFEAYSRFYLRPYPEQMKFYLSDLQPNIRYRVMVQAYDSFDNASMIKDVVFKTEGESIELPNTLPDTIEDGKFMDINFNNQDLTDSEEQITAKVQGNVNYEEGIDGAALHIPASDGGYVDLGNNEKMSGNSDLTLNFWINSKRTNSDAPIISNKNWGRGGNPGWYVGYRLGYLTSVGVNISDGSTRIDFDGYASFENNWKMVSVIFDKTTSMSKIYIDGIENSSRDLSGIENSIATDYSVKIGSDGTGSYGSRADFSIDNLQMWNRVLNPEEILAIYGTVIYEEDTTDYAEKLNGLIVEAEAILSEYETGAEGIYYNEETALHLREQVEAAKKAQTKEEQQIFCGELSYLIEKMQAEKEWCTISKTGFSVVDCDSWHGDHGESDYGESRLYAPEKAIDENSSTAWHTNWSVADDGSALFKFPHSIIIDMQESYSLSGIERIGRSNRDYIKDYAVDVSDDLEALKTDSKADVEGTFKDSVDAYDAFGKALKGRYVKVTILDVWAMQEEGEEGKQWSYTAELNFTGHKVSDEKSITVKTNGNGTVSPTEITVLAGDEAEFELVPDEGYEVKDIIVTGASGEKEFLVNESVLIISDVQEYLEVSVSFSEKQTIPEIVDKSKLSKAIADAEYILTRKDDYQEATLQGLTEALEQAKAAAEDQAATQEEVDRVTTVLEKEIEQVRPVEDKDSDNEEEGTNKPTNPDDNNKQPTNPDDSNKQPTNPKDNNKQPTKQIKTEAVKTGDKQNIALPGSAFLVALGAFVMLVKRKIRK